MKPVEKLLEKLKVIEKVERYYLTSSIKQLYIKDNQKTGTSTLSETCENIKLCFSISNTSGKSVHFIPIDGKEGILGFGISNCDAVFFSEKQFSFLELKLNATSLADTAVLKNRRKSVGQLESTIQFFDEKLEKNYEGLSIEAIIATPSFYPRLDSSWQDISTEFLEKNRIELFETTKKVYQ